MLWYPMVSSHIHMYVPHRQIGSANTVSCKHSVLVPTLRYYLLALIWPRTTYLLGMYTNVTSSIIA